ncbi:D-alanyl-D-alanine carboxypeptidase family protein [Bacillus sp. AFS040349]|uniref:M15 family metallopeptidase n=1 Tax=Bacillus sp. AFS040349 TaxID=2033502 RepID=UPI000BFCC2EF|nr:M15 family metallopeptidase [Bacillus sp. AFS040349]PGT85324.1 peptidase M15 [Bacillus sp. AFS040349]
MFFFFKSMTILVFVVIAFSAYSSKTIQVSQEIKKSGMDKGYQQLEPMLLEKIEDDFTIESQYFNVIAMVDNNRVIQNPSNILALVNKEYSLPENYKPLSLVIPNIKFSFEDREVEKRYVRQEAASALEALFKRATIEGIELIAISGYRSFSRQQNIYNAEKNSNGEAVARQVVAFPGESEHQTGLAMDVSSKSLNFELLESFGETTEGKWLKENAHKEGYIIRYPKGKESITGYKYEPWHLRYVGKKQANIIYKHNLTLEEFIKKVRKM